MQTPLQQIKHCTRNAQLFSIILSTRTENISILELGDHRSLSLPFTACLFAP